METADCTHCGEEITRTDLTPWENSEGRYACPAQRDTYHEARPGTIERTED